MLRLSPAGNARLEQARTLAVHVAGTESNTLACLSRLGMRCAWLSALPSNPLGRLVAGELESHGVSTSHVVWCGDPIARLGTYWVEEAPAPLGTQVVYDRAHSAIASLDPNAIEPSVIDTARLLHLTGITPALSPQARAIFHRLINRARERNVPISFDVNYRAKLWTAQEAARELEEPCHAADLLFCTRSDAAELWGLTGDPASVLTAMSDRFGHGNTEKSLVLTLGAEGSAQLRRGEYTHAPAYPTAGTARFGSGDAFAAGYLYAFLDGSHYVTLRDELGLTPLHFGNATAALKRCIEGDIAIVTPHEVLSVLRGGQNARFR